jgi:hypothetical protein
MTREARAAPEFAAFTVTAAPLLAARALGYRIGTLQSSGLGFGVYRRLGFTEQFRYALYVHVPGGARFGSG